MSDDAVVIWDVATKSVQKRLTGHKDSVTAVLWSPDGQLLASGSRDETVRLWNTAPSGKTGFQEAGFQNEGVLEAKSGVFRMAFSPDGRYLAAIVNNKSVLVWSMDSQELVSTIRHRTRPNGLAFAGGPTTLWTVGANLLKAWDIHAVERVDTLRRAELPHIVGLATVAGKTSLLTYQSGGPIRYRGLHEAASTVLWGSDETYVRAVLSIGGR